MSSTEKDSDVSAVTNSMQSISQTQPLVNLVMQPDQIHYLNNIGTQLCFRPLALYNTSTRILTPIAAQPTVYQPSFQQLQQYVIVPPVTTTILCPAINSNLQSSNNNVIYTANLSVGHNPVPPEPPESSDQVSSSTETKTEEVIAESTNISLTCVTPTSMQDPVPQLQALRTAMDCKPLPKTDETQNGKKCEADDNKITMKHVVSCRKVSIPPALLKELRRHLAGKRTVFCAHCEKGYPRKSKLRVHLKSHENPELNDKSKNGNQIRGPDGKVRHFCRFSNCRRVFGHASTLKRHENLHSRKQDKFVCTYCEKEFSQKNEIALHEEMMHANVKRNESKGERNVCSGRQQVPKERLICHVAGCGRGYSSVGNLNAHLRLHNNDRPHACKICGRKYSFKCYLRKHERSHRVEKID